MLLRQQEMYRKLQRAAKSEGTVARVGRKYGKYLHSNRIWSGQKAHLQGFSRL